VVIECLPAGVYGIAPAAAVAKDMLRTFKSLRFGPMFSFNLRLTLKFPGANIQKKSDETGFLDPPTRIFAVIVRMSYFKIVVVGRCMRGVLVAQGRRSLER
jgi:hypothetical protein